jgi:hypothetical protein
MDVKRLAIGTVVGAVVLLLLGYLIWEVLFSDYFAANVTAGTGVEREGMIVWSLILGQVLYALLLTLALESERVSGNAIKGLGIGAAVGILLWGTADFTMYAFNDLTTLNSAIADTLLSGVHAGVAGLIIVIALGFIGGAKTASG